MSAKISSKSRFRQLLSHTTFYGGFCLLSDALNLNRGGRILGYHSITETPSDEYAVSISDFEGQMRFLAENYRVVSIDELVNEMETGIPIQKNTVSISFDDGFLDFYTNGFPILQKYRLPATVFLPTGLIDGTLPPSGQVPNLDFLSWNQVRELQHLGIDFGSHTVTHATLVNQTPQEIMNELKQSKARIEQEIGEVVRGFAYPYGTFRHVHPKIERAIIDAGYAWAVTTISGVNHLSINPFELRRTVIAPVDGQAGFKRVLEGSLDGWYFIQKLGYYLDRVKPFN